MNQIMENICITWYGRCCFLIEYQEKKIIFDPYDTYCNVDIGQIEADVLISSSSWHDHGHIGASPSAHIYSYPGFYQHGDFKITGIEALENRGTPTVIFNVAFGPYSVTNFADFGPAQQETFDKTVTEKEKQVLDSTNIAFIRASIIGEKDKDHGNEHNENIFNYCQPSLIFLEHYFPKSFTEEQVEESKKKSFLKPLIVYNELIEILDYPVRKVNGYSLSLSPHDLDHKTLYQFLRLHPQVVYNSQNTRNA